MSNSILRRRKKMKLSVDAVAHLFSIMSKEDRRTITRLLGKVQGIMPKTKKQLRDLPNHKLVSKVLTQQILHKNKEINYHRGGSLFDAVHSLWTVGKAVLGSLFGHVSEHENNRKLTEKESEMAKLVSAAYETGSPLLANIIGLYASKNFFQEAKLRNGELPQLKRYA